MIGDRTAALYWTELSCIFKDFFLEGQLSDSGKRLLMFEFNGATSFQGASFVLHLQYISQD